MSAEITEFDLQHSSEKNIRRLARWIGLEESTLTLPQIHEAFRWKGIVKSKRGRIY